MTKYFTGKVISSQDRVTWDIAPITNNFISPSKIREMEGMRETQFSLRTIVNAEQMYRKIRRTILRSGHVCSKWPKSKTLNHFWLRLSWGHIWIFLKSVDLTLLGNHCITFNFWLWYKDGQSIVQALAMEQTNLCNRQAFSVSFWNINFQHFAVLNL